MKKIIFLFLGIVAFVGFFNKRVDAADDNCVSKDSYSWIEVDSQDKQEWINDSLKILGYDSKEKQEEFLAAIKKSMSDDDAKNFTKIDEETFFTVVKRYEVKDSTGKVIFIVLDPFWSTWSPEYIFFAKDDKNWKITKVLALADKYHQDDDSPYLFNFQNKNFICFSGSDGGSGADRYWVECYSLNDNGTVPVLVYPRHGHRGGWGLAYDMEFAATQIEVKTDKDGCYLETILTMEFSGEIETVGDKGVKSIKILEKKYPVRYEWNRLRSRFVLKSGPGDFKDDSFDPFDIWASNAKFIDCFYEDLKEMANGQDPNKKIWLKDLLEDDQSKKAEKWPALAKLVNLSVK